jgi:hypothetical protein
MTSELREKLKRVYALVKQGATEGERDAAERVLNNLLKKYNLNGLDLESLEKPVRKFSYISNNEMILLTAIVRYFISVEKVNTGKRYLHNEKSIGFPLTDLEFITVECAYEYFRRHMKQQWKKVCEPELKKCRKTKTKNKRRAALQHIFINRYIIASKLYLEGDLSDVETTSKHEYADRVKMQNVEGGNYNVQVQSAHALSQGTLQLNP